jgi:EamA domain-containing membrane protein RarD
MKLILIIGTSIVNLALIAYSIFIYQERKYRLVTRKLLIFLTIGVLLDITATTCMIIGSSKSPFTMHGILGYSSLTAMFIDAVLIWRNKIKQGINAAISNAIHNYSLIAYIWWILAYITGALLVLVFR